jgi:hypothetical protein
MSQINSFEKYSAKVFKMGEVLSLLEDNRHEPDIDIKNIFLGYYFGSALRMKATSTIEEETRDGVLKKRVGDISDDTIGYGLDHLDVESIQKGWYMLAIRAKRNGMLRNSPFHDYIVGVLDGIETYSSYSEHRHCDRCLIRVVETNKGKKIQYYHRSVVLTLVGYDFPIPIGLEMMKKGEDEVACALRLLKRIVDNLGTQFLDIVICDALYCNPNFFDECEKLRIHAGAVLKDNQENLLQSAHSQKKVTSPVIEKDTDEEKLKLWDFGEVFWDTADQDVRVIWADRKVWEKEKVGKKGKKKKKKKKKKKAEKVEMAEMGEMAGMGGMGGKGRKMKKEKEKEKDKDKDEDEDEISKSQSLHLQWKWVDKKKVFAFSKKIDHLPSDVVYSIGIHRWDIDAKIFMDMVKHWHLKHKTLHFKNAYENMLSIRLISYLVFMFFFFRHINSRRKKKIKLYIEMARILYRSACNNLKPEILLLE